MSELDKNLHTPSIGSLSPKTNETTNALDGSLDKFGKSIEHISAVEVIEKSQEKAVTGGSSTTGQRKKSSTTTVKTPIPPALHYIPETPKELIAALTPKIKEQIINLTKVADKIQKEQKPGFASQLQNTIKDLRQLSRQLFDLVHLTVSTLKGLYKGFFPKAIDRSATTNTKASD